jgi:hypothetical protein
LKKEGNTTFLDLIKPLLYDICQSKSTHVYKNRFNGTPSMWAKLDLGTSAFLQADFMVEGGHDSMKNIHEASCTNIITDYREILNA